MRYIFVVILLLAQINLFSQSFEVPENYEFKTADDYAPYEQEVINCVNWMLSTPMDEQGEKGKSASAFLLKWLVGSPDVIINVNGKIVNFSKNAPELTLIFMGGWAKYSLESRKFDDEEGGNLAGIESVITFYNKNRHIIPEIKEIEKYIKMKDNGTLKKFIKKNVG